MTDITRQPVCELVTPLKGSRQYVHSTDLLAALESEACRRLGTGAWVRNLTIRRQAAHLVDAWFEPRGDALGSFRLQGPSQSLRGWLVESSRSFAWRVSYDEESLLDRVCDEGDVAVLPGPVDGFTRYEQMVALFKALATRQMPGPWVVAQFDFECPLPRLGPLEARYPRTIDGRLKFGVLSQKGSAIGAIRAILPEADQLGGMGQ
jgi:hypothetical protein